MAHFIAFAKKGINLDQVVTWEDGWTLGYDNVSLPCLWVTFAVASNEHETIQVPLSVSYIKGEREALLAYLTDHSTVLPLPQPRPLPVHQPLPQDEPATPSDDCIPF